MTHTVPPNVIPQRDSDPNLEAAELEVKRAEAAFSETLHDASEAGRAAAQRVAKAAKPVLIGAAVLATLGLAVFGFNMIWEQYLLPLIVAADPSDYTLTVALLALRSDDMVGTGIVLAGALLALVPSLVVYLSLQKSFLRGITTGAIKG